MTYNSIWQRALGGLFCVALLSSCTNGFDNLNHHQATDEMLEVDNLKTGAFFTQMERNVVPFKDGSNDDGTYQIAQGLTSDLYAGYLTTTINKDNGKNTSNYYFIENWVQQIFKCGFTGVMPAWQSITQVAEDLNQPEVAALAMVIKVEAMHRVTDTYGPIPYINFGAGSLVSLYDSQEDIYKKFFEELDGAIDALTEFHNGNPKATIMADYDYVYGGDVAKWIRFANTLRLRLAMRVVYADETLARTEAEKSASHPLGVIEEAGDRAQLQHSAQLIYHHPLWEISYNFNGGEDRMSANMDSYLNGYNDPRLAAYFKPAASDGKYHGVRLGIIGNTDSYKGDKISNLNMDDSSTPITWMTAAESYFLRAEGALRGWNMGGTAEDFYNKGIEISFAENNVKGADTYINDDTSVPAAFEDNVGNDSKPALSTITIKWNESDSFEKKLERIITQKWIAGYPDGPEGWAEYRRTGYPKLFPVVHNYSDGTISDELQVRRLPYPKSERDNNAQGVASGISKLGGADNGGTRLWWDRKN